MSRDKCSVDYIRLFFASALVCLIQAKVVTRVEDAVTSLSFQLQKIKSKSVNVFP